MPGPGAYNPVITKEGRGLAVDISAKHSHNVEHRAGKAGFLTKMSARLTATQTSQVPSGFWEKGLLTEPANYNPTMGRELADEAKTQPTRYRLLASKASEA